MSAQAIDSFYVELFFKDDVVGALRFQEQMENVRGALFKFSAIAVGATAGLFAFVEGVAHSMAELNEFSEINDLAVDSVAALGKAGMVADVGMDAIKSSLQGLTTITGEAARGVGRGAMIFKKLGVSAKDSSGHVRDAFEMLEVVADKIKGLSRPEQLAYLEKLRIDPSMVKILKDGRENLHAMIEEARGASVIDKKYYEQAEQVDRKFKRVKNAAGLTLKQLAVQLFQATEHILDGILDWYKAQQKVAKESGLINSFKVLGDVIYRVTDMVKDGLKPLGELKDWLDKTGISGAGIGVAFGLITSFAIGKFFLSAARAANDLAGALLAVNVSGGLLAISVGLVAIAFFLLWDDINTAKNGGDSLIGSFDKWLDSFGAFGASMKGILKGVAMGFAAWATFAALAWAATIGPIAVGLVGLGLIVAWFIGLKDTIKDAIDWVKKFWDALFGGDDKDKTVTLTKETKEILDSAAVMSKAGKAGYKPSTSVYGPGASGGLLGTAERSLASQSSQTSNLTTVNAPITINGATDSQAVGAEVQKHLQRETQRASRDAQNGNGAWY